MPLSWKKLSQGGLDPKILINDDNMQLLVSEIFFLETSFKGSSIGEKNGFWVLAARKLCRGDKDPDMSMKGDQTLLVMPMLFVNTHFFRSFFLLRDSKRTFVKITSSKRQRALF